MVTMKGLLQTAVVYILSEVIIQVACFDCSNTVCPTNLPYCSPVGCVFECPIGSFIDDIACVTDCGPDKYIYDHQCVNACPQSAPLVETEIVTIGLRFVKRQYCRGVCPARTYETGSTCMRSCPEDIKFVEGGVCKKSCSPNRFHRNITVDGQLTAIRCETSCGPWEFIQDGYCVKGCRQGQVIYKTTCLGTCPSDAEIHDTDEDTGLTYCKSKCEDNGLVPPWSHPYEQDKKCVSKCNASLVINDGNCVSSCPRNKRLKFVDKWRNVHCQENCSREYTGATIIEDGFCVSRCKDGHVVYQGHCIDSCPENVPIHVLNRDDDNVYCKTKCDDSYKRFMFNNSCVDDCPKTMNFIFNSSCMANCPSEAPFHCKKGSGYNEGFHDGSCNAAGDYDVTSYYACLRECPGGMPFRDEHTCTRKGLHASYGVLACSVLALGILVAFGIFMSMKKCGPSQNTDSGTNCQSSQDVDDSDRLCCEDDENVVLT